MKNISIVLIGSFIVLLFSSCEDFFSTTLEIDPPPYEELLVVHAYGNARTNKLEVSVAKSVGLLDDVSNIYENLINDAVVKLITPLETYTLDKSNSDNYPINYVLPENVYEFNTDYEYTLEVTANGFPDVTAKTELPPLSSIGPVTFKEDGPSDGFEDFSSIEFTLSDNVSSKDYYEAFLLKRSIIEGQASFLPTYILDYRDPVMEPGLSYESILLKDDSFEGEDKSVQLLIDEWYVNNGDTDIDELYIAFRDVSDDHYLYSRSAHQNVDNAENPFASPVQVYTNIENGIGVFSIFQERLLKVN